MGKDLRELSRTQWTTESIKPSIEEISLGAQLRIADSLERIERPYQKLIDDYNYVKAQNQNLNESNQRLLNQIRALKGWVTRLKRKEVTNV